MQNRRQDSYRGGILQHPNTGYAADGEGGHWDPASAGTQCQKQPQGFRRFGDREPFTSITVPVTPVKHIKS